MRVVLLFHFVIHWEFTNAKVRPPEQRNDRHREIIDTHQTHYFTIVQQTGCRINRTWKSLQRFFDLYGFQDIIPRASSKRDFRHSFPRKLSTRSSPDMFPSEMSKRNIHERFPAVRVVLLSLSLPLRGGGLSVSQEGGVARWVGGV